MSAPIELLPSEIEAVIAAIEYVDTPALGATGVDRRALNGARLTFERARDAEKLRERAKRLEFLAEKCADGYDVDDQPERFAAVWSYSEDTGDGGVSTHPTLAAALEQLADVTAGTATPDGVYDLDTCEHIAVNVSVSVTRSEDEHAAYNVLSELKR